MHATTAFAVVNLFVGSSSSSSNSMSNSMSSSRRRNRKKGEVGRKGHGSRQIKLMTLTLSGVAHGSSTS